MPTPTYVALATTTLASTAASVTFGSIPATYRDLVVVYDAIAGSAQETALALNGSTSSGSFVYMYGDGSSTFSGTNTTMKAGTVSTNPSVNIVQFMDYSATDKHKTYLVRSNRPSEAVLAYAHRWASTAAINSIELFPTSGSWSSGGTFSLYGIEA